MNLDWNTKGVIALLVVSLFMALIGDKLVRRLVAGPGRAERGIAAFKDPFELELATAIAACDVARVKALLPKATYQNLNDLRGNTTLFLFALEQGMEKGPATAERLELVRAMIAGGGGVGYPQGRALEAVSSQGRAMIELVLDAGAYVNEKSPAGEHPWRQWIRRDAKGQEQVEMLRLFIARGADLNSRYVGPSTVAQAMGQESWETALVLVEAGAKWTEADLPAKARAALERYEGREAPEALRKLVAKLG
jgi:hypothetical protein